MRRLQIKFPNQIRISGWDFGSSARAMNQAGGKDSLMTYECEFPQAELGKGLNSTTERKSMSTKTTIKRIALVAVSALGLGMVSGVATAAPTTQTYTASLVPNTTSITRVTSNTDATGAAIFKLRAYDESGASTALFGLESITVSVYAVPNIDTKTVALNASDIAYAGVKAASQTAGTYAAETSANLKTDGTALTITNSATEGSSYDTADGTTAADVNGTYFLAVYPTSSALNKGYYTLRLRLQNQSGFITDQYIKVQFVTSAADSGAVITLTKTGTISTGAVLGVTTDNRITATVKDANGGLIQTDLAAGASAYDISAPTLNAQIRNSSTLVVSDTLVASDNGTAATDGTAADHVAPTTSTAVSATAALAYMDGTYGLTKSTALAADDTSTYNQVRAWYGSVEKVLALTVANAPTNAGGTLTFSGVGNLASSTPFTLPLTTKTASFKVSGAAPGKAYYYSVVWTKVGAGDQTPLDSTPTTVYADAAGYITVPVTNGNPVDGAQAVVTISGFASSNPGAQTINWVKSKATNISVDMGGATVALKSTNVITATVTDAFGAPVAGVLLQPALSSTSSNYAAATVYPTVTTNAAGQATFSLTDASAVAAGTDTVSFSAVDGTSWSATSTSSATLKYAATAPAATSLSVYYSPTPSTTSTDAAVVTAVPATGIYVNGTSTKFQVQKDTNFGLSISTADSKDQVKMRVSAGVAGVKVTATGSAGVYFLNGGFATTTLSKYTGTTGYTSSWVIGTTKAGANTVTFTSGSVTQTAAFWSETGAGNARFVKLAQDATTGAVTATVTDRYGNGISNVNVQLSTSAGTLGNGQLTAVFATNLDGAVSVLPAGAEEAVITATLTDTTANDTAAPAGYSGTTVIDSTVAAGNKTATLTIKPTTSATDAATSATDAANEATDAANAATDAANAAAEAADAATAAAQDAQAAVAELATKVASLIAGIKAQITTLTNLVIKIQKKVRA